MKGFLAAMYDRVNAARYSDVQVLQSAAGWYVGTTFTEEEGYETPGSRESEEYYATQAEAQAALDNDTFTQRAHP